MDRTTFVEEMVKLQGEEVELFIKKAKDYSNESNVFSHFESEAETLHMSPQQLLYVYLEKHLKAITKYCMTGEQDSQGIRERIKDARIYLALLECMPSYQTVNKLDDAVKIDYTMTHYSPDRAHPTDAGWDLKLTEELTLAPGQRGLGKTGIRMFIPEGYEVQIRPRSGLAIKHGVTVINSPGTIDSGYIGEVMVPLINHGAEPMLLIKGSKVAQAVVHKLPNVVFNFVHELPDTQRGANGFGSTGM